MQCRPAGAATPAPAVLELMHALLHGEWSATEDVPGSVRGQASGLVAAHLQWHLERQLRTLPLIERSRPHLTHDLAGAVRQDDDRDPSSTSVHSG